MAKINTLICNYIMHQYIDWYPFFQTYVSNVLQYGSEGKKLVLPLPLSLFSLFFLLSLLPSGPLFSYYRSTSIKPVPGIWKDQTNLKLKSFFTADIEHFLSTWSYEDDGVASSWTNKSLHLEPGSLCSLRLLEWLNPYRHKSPVKPETTERPLP